jgi:hypothetical protein
MACAVTRRSRPVATSRCSRSPPTRCARPADSGSITFRATATRVGQRSLRASAAPRRAIACSADDQEAPRRRAALSHRRESRLADGVVRRSRNGRQPGVSRPRQAGRRSVALVVRSSSQLAVRAHFRFDRIVSKEAASIRSARLSVSALSSHVDRASRRAAEIPQEHQRRRGLQTLPQSLRGRRTNQGGCTKLTTPVFPDLMGARQAAEADPPRPKRLTPESELCRKRTKGRGPRWFVRRPPCRSGRVTAGEPRLLGQVPMHNCRRRCRVCCIACGSGRLRPREPRHCRTSSAARTAAAVGSARADACRRQQPSTRRKP